MTLRLPSRRLATRLASLVTPLVAPLVTVVALVTLLSPVLILSGCSASAGDGSTDSDDLGDFPPPPDANTTPDIDSGPVGFCPKDPCDVYDQCGCATSEACDLDGDNYASGGTECRAADPTGQSQASCEANADCAAGYTCVGSPGQCRKFCEGDGDCGNGRCVNKVYYRDGNDELQPIPGIDTCSKACKPESPTGSGCPTGYACRYEVDDDGAEDVWYTDCRAAGAGTDGTDCSENFGGDCAAGYTCVVTGPDDAKVYTCRQVCVWEVNGSEGPRECAANACAPYGEEHEVIIGNTEYGVCLPPPE